MINPTFDLDLGVGSQALCVLRLLSGIPADYFCEEADKFKPSVRALYERSYAGGLLISCGRGVASLEYFNVLIHEGFEGNIKVLTFKGDAPMGESVEVSDHFEEEFFQPMEFGAIVDFVCDEIKRFYEEEGLAEPLSEPVVVSSELIDTTPPDYQEGSYKAYMLNFSNNVKPRILKNSPTIDCTRGQEKGTYIFHTSVGTDVIIKRQDDGKFSVEIPDYSKTSDIASMVDAKIQAELNLFYARKHWAKERQRHMENGVVFLSSEIRAYRINEEGRGQVCNLNTGSYLPDGDWHYIGELAELNCYKAQSILGLSRHCIRNNIVEPLEDGAFLENGMTEVFWNEEKRQWRSIFEK